MPDHAYVSLPNSASDHTPPYPKNRISWFNIRRALPILVAASLLGVFGGAYWVAHDYGYAPHSLLQRRNTMIIMADSRAPIIPTDPKEVIPFITITTLINYKYAMDNGADFTFIVYDKPESPGRPNANDPVCHHPRHGWRAASWCKLPAVWDTVIRNPGKTEFMFIDSDAAFRNETLAPVMHLGHLTPFKPIGFVSNRPFDGGVCAGYFFLRREAVPFLKTWWDVDAAKANLKRLWEQDALNALFRNGIPKNETSLSNPAYLDRIVNLQNERQFSVNDPNQLIRHVSSMEPKRYQVIESLWRNKLVALSDREALRHMISKVNIRHLNATEVALRMEAS